VVEQVIGRDFIFFVGILHPAKINDAVVAVYHKVNLGAG
jgi:hypothetical protein